MEIPLLETDLILNADGSIYHLNLHPEELAETVILVGDPARVPKTSVFFDSIEIKKQKREFVTHTGYIGKKRVSVVSTGISTANIDIVMNELDALVNIDLKARTVKSQSTALNIIHMGTSGAVSKDIPVDSLIVSTAGFALEGLLSFYRRELSENELAFSAALYEHFNALPTIHSAYFAEADKAETEKLTSHATIGRDTFLGITLTSCGFYGPQGRQLRAKLADYHVLDLASTFSFRQDAIVNLEMETATIFAMSKLLNHRASSISAVVANRLTHQFSDDPDKTVKAMIEHTVHSLAA